MLRTAFTEDERRALLQTIKAERGEGIVFKNASARYAPGRAASGGDALKHKFTASATCCVISHNRGKRSVLVAAHNDAADASAPHSLIENQQGGEGCHARMAAPVQRIEDALDFELPQPDTTRAASPRPNINPRSLKRRSNRNPDESPKPERP